MRASATRDDRRLCDVDRHSRNLLLAKLLWMRLSKSGLDRMDVESWYLVAKDDRMIPPGAQPFMSRRAGATVVETPGSHALCASRPEPVAKLIALAASSVRVTAAR
jgi:hypothetical protein